MDEIFAAVTGFLADDDPNEAVDIEPAIAVTHESKLSAEDDIKSVAPVEIEPLASAEVEPEKLYDWPQVQPPAEEEIDSSLLTATYVDRGPAFQIDRQISFWANYFDLSITPIQEHSDTGQDMLYVVKHIFTTRDGSWEPSDLPGSIPQWASKTYANPLQGQKMEDEANGAHNLFGIVMGFHGDFMPQESVQFWQNDVDRLENASSASVLPSTHLPQSGWHHLPIQVDSRYQPQYTSAHTDSNGKQWCWTPVSDQTSESVLGGNLPAEYQVSIYVVWQAIPNKIIKPSSLMPAHMAL